MFMKNITLRVIVCFIVSLFVGLPLAEAYPSTTEFETAKTDRDSAADERTIWKNRFDAAEGTVNALLGEWNTNATAIKDGTWEVVDTAIATLIAELIRNTNNDDGKSTIERIVEALPSIFGAYSTWRRTAETANHIARRDQYLSALSTAVGALNEIRAENQLAFDTYEDEYDKYLELMAASSHTGGLVRVENYSPQGNYTNLTALDIEAIKTTVKAATAFRDGKLKKWYHPNDIKSSSQPTSHSFGRFHDFDSFWKLNPLPKSKRCGGDCGQQFQTPVEHLVVCPYALTVSSMQAGNRRLTGLPIDTPLPDGKASPAGCDDAYYVCDSGDRNEHKIRICGKNNSNGNRCNEPYRNCNNSKYDHGGWGSTKHKEKAGNLIMGSLPSPVMYACGVHESSVSGSHTSYTCNISPCSNFVWWGCVDAQCPETDTHGKVVCTISGCQDSTPYDPTSSSGGWHAPCDECSQYRCKGGDHSWQTSCTDTAHTNANGDSCTVAGYECVSHTPMYPAPPPPTATCSQCSGSYDPNGVHAWKHQPRTCVKAKWVRLSESSVEYRTCTNTFYRCTNGNSTCQTGDIWCIDANGVI